MFGKAIGVLKSNLKEFKDFAFKGNLIQLAIGVVLGAAFGKLIESFVKLIFMPVISLFTSQAGGGAGYDRWQWRGIAYGAFIGELINFCIIALAIFILMVKVVGLLGKLGKKDEAAAPTEKECPMCCMKVPLAAKKCCHCTSDLPQPA